MRGEKMRNGIFRAICVASGAVLLAAVVIVMGALYGYFSSAQQEQLRAQTELAARAVSNEGMDFFEQEMPDLPRITWIDSDGSVLYDTQSDAADMENHADREEFREAQRIGYGESARYSSTLTRRQIYAAKALADGTVLRLSDSHLSLLSLFIISFQPILLLIIIACLIAFLLASKLSERIVRPLNELDLDAADEDPSGYAELSPLLERIAHQQRQLRSQSAELRKKQEEFAAATDNMNEGLILLNESGIILSINKAACRLLSVNSYCIGKDMLLLDRSLEVQELLRKAQKGERSETMMRLSSGDFQFIASPVITDSSVTGIAILIFDITEKEKAERSRREFTANVSHELKTPLQSISGCAELLKNGMVQENDKEAFYQRIDDEARRMITLVEDIIGLTRLEEGAIGEKWESVELKSLAEEAVRILRPAADEKNVSLSLSGQECTLWGVAGQLRTMLYNLTDNAIKYNRENGSVTLKIEENGDEAVLSVIDTGIGIPEEDRERIFERFYRVDKSRSRQMGGTGLGLSIVKHAAKLHGAKVELSSVIDGGTTVTVRFPKKRKGE